MSTVLPSAAPAASRTAVRRPVGGARIAAAVVLAVAAAGTARAKVVEEVTSVPVRVVDAYGKVTEQDIVVTVWRDDAVAPPYPVLVLGHGRAAKAVERAAMGRATYGANARWFAGLGLLVAVPTRVGYGVSGGPDVEDSGNCQRKNYPPGYEAAAQQTLAVLERMRERPDAARDRALVVGQSYGGTTAIAVAAKSPPGVLATINFAGGGGGNPETQARDPCGAGLLERLFAQYGRSARIPTLWVYTENDQWMGPTHPREWYDAFRQAGGVGEFVLYPPYGDDGHGLFVKAPKVWRERVEGFLRETGVLGTTPERPRP